MQLWFDFLQKLETTLGKDNVDKWLRSLKILRFDACNLYLEAKDFFQKNWFEEHALPILKTTFVNNNNRPIHIHLQIANAKKKEKKYRESKTRLIVEPNELNIDASLFSFIPPEKSLMTFRLICELTGYNQDKKCLEKPKLKLASFNPLYIYGPSGSGKTHLLMACAYSLNKQGYKTFYVKAQTFTDHVVHAIRLAQMDIFRKTYRNIDILLIDDIHLLKGKKATQEEFFHTFNYLHQNNCQIILTSHTLPMQLEDIEDRLISRFEWGLSLRLENLDTKKKYQVLLQKVKQYHLQLHQETLDFLHQSFHSLPLMQKALEALVLHTHLNDNTNPLDQKTAQIYLEPLLQEQEKKALTPEKIIRNVADFFGIKSSDILGKSQTRECTRPRQLAMYLCRQKLKIPLMSIGKIFARDHSTVITSIRQIEKNLEEKNQEIYNAYLDITKQFKN